MSLSNHWYIMVSNLSNKHHDCRRKVRFVQYYIEEIIVDVFCLSVTLNLCSCAELSMSSYVKMKKRVHDQDELM